MIELKTFNKKELEEFVVSGRFQQYDFLPITKHRAFSQIKNPQASAEDVLLTLAFYEKKLAGYLGTLPDQFHYQGNTQKIAWLSTLFVHENFRGKKIAQLLLDKVFEVYDAKIAITEFTKEAESLYNKMGVFTYITPKIGKRFYVKSNLEKLLPLKKPKISSLSMGFKMLDAVVNSALDVKKNFQKISSVHYQFLNSIDNETLVFLQKFNPRRNAQELAWIVLHPWVLESEGYEDKYLFSSYSKESKYFLVKIIDEEKHIVSFAMLYLRDGHLKIPYYFSEGDHQNFSEFLKHFIREQNVKMFTSYHENLNRVLLQKLSFLHQKNIERRYFFHKNLITLMPKNFEINFQDGDGDCVFT